MSEKVYPPLEGDGQQQAPYPPASGAPGVQVPMAPPSYDQTQAQGPPPAVPMAGGYPAQPAYQGQSGYPGQGANPDPPPAGSIAIPMAPAPGQQTPAVISGPEFRDHSVGMTCPTCKAEITTTVHEDVGVGAWVFCLAMFCAGFIFIFPFCFCCVPWCIPAFKTFKHTCPSCRANLGTYKGPLSMS